MKNYILKNSGILSLVLFIAVTLVSCCLGSDRENGFFLSAMVAGAIPVVSKFDPGKIKIPEGQFNELKAKHGKLYVIDVTIDDDESFQFIARRPSRSLIDAIASTKDLTKSNDMIVKNMILAGDTDALDDGLVYSSLLKSLGGVMKTATNFLSKA